MDFISPNSQENCTAAQLIAEIMVTRKATKNRISLPYKFWNLPEYKKEFKQHIIAANAFLKLYTPQAILSALKRKDAQWQYTLRAGGLPDIIDEEQRRINNEEKLIKESVETKTENPAEFRQIGTGQKSIKSRLD